MRNKIAKFIENPVNVLILCMGLAIGGLIFLLCKL